jgi:uncharacterized membrane protein (DUF4010 family)
MIAQSLGLFYKFFLSIALGALIGAEREKSHQQHTGTDFAGVRTFMLITFFGTLTAYLSTLYYSWLLAVIFVCFVVVVLAGYIFSSYYNKEIGMTTELSTLIAFFIGVLVYTSSEEIPAIITITLTLILSFKVLLHRVVYNLKSNEFFDTMKFVVIAFVILPLLQNLKSFGPFNSINLHEIWLMVVFVSTFSFIGYILTKIFGTGKGTLLTGFLGGFLSSTAVVTTFAHKSKEYNGNVLPFVIASVIACSTMFLRVLAEVTILNADVIAKLAFPMVLMALAGYITISFMWRKNNHEDAHIEFSSPLLFWPAIKFGLFYALVVFISNISNEVLGVHGLLLAAIITGIHDADAIALFVARHPEIDIRFGILAIVVAAVSNTITKVIIGKLFGSKEYGRELMKMMTPIVIVGLVLLLILL